MNNRSFVIKLVLKLKTKPDLNHKLGPNQVFTKSKPDLDQV